MNAYNRPKLEACVESFEEAMAAQIAGADQIELCSRLDLDGLTPAAALIEQCVSCLNIPVKVMVRPHGGAFRYAPEELKEMEDTVAIARKKGAFGVVFGFLNSDLTVDLGTTRQFLRHCKGLDLTFHKAIDQTPDPAAAVKELLTFNTNMNVLSAGGANSAAEGASTLKAMMKAGEDRINIIPAGRINADNWKRLHSELNASIYHGRRIVG